MQLFEVAVLTASEAAAEGEDSADFRHEGAVILPIIHEFRDAVMSKVGAWVARQEAARIEHVPQCRVEEHHGGLKDVEVPLVPQDWAQTFKGLEVTQVDLGVAQVLDETIDTSDEDEHHAAVESYEHDADRFGL